MNKLVLGMAFVACCSIPQVASATFAFYNVPTGAIYFVKDQHTTFVHATLVSFSGSLKGPQDLVHIPSALAVDDTEFPYAYTYIGDLPVGWNFTGYTVKPFTPPSDLRFQYRVGSFVSPLITEEVVILIPEPSSCLTLAVAATAVVGLVRRSRR